MKRAEHLIKLARRGSENEQAGSTGGISDEEPLQWLTDAVRFLQSKIMLANAERFRRTEYFVATGVEAYDLPWDCYLSNQVIDLSYSSTGNTEDYTPLTKVIVKERLSETGAPARYLLEGRTVLVNRFPASGSFRITYNALAPSVDKRRATVASFTAGAGSLTALTLSGYTAEDFENFDYLTVVDFSGAVKMRGVPYTAIDANTGVVSIYAGSYTYPAGSLISNGDFVCLGEYASTHPQVDDALEPFLVTYTQRRFLKRDSSLDANDIAEELRDMWMDALALYGESQDEMQVPITQNIYFGEFT